MCVCALQVRSGLSLEQKVDVLVQDVHERLPPTASTAEHQLASQPAGSAAGRGETLPAGASVGASAGAASGIEGVARVAAMVERLEAKQEVAFEALSKAQMTMADQLQTLALAVAEISKDR